MHLCGRERLILAITRANEEGVGENKKQGRRNGDKSGEVKKRRGWEHTEIKGGSRWEGKRVEQSRARWAAALVARPCHSLLMSREICGDRKWSCRLSRPIMTLSGKDGRQRERHPVTWAAPQPLRQTCSHAGKNEHTLLHFPWERDGREGKVRNVLVFDACWPLECLWFNDCFRLE